MVVISKKIAEDLTRYCRTRLPEEACGALIGFIDKNSVKEMHITRFIPITNRSAHPTTSFSFDAEEWVALVIDDHDEHNNRKSHQSQLIGTFHSHPTAPVTPSVHDLDTAWGHLPIHLIVALESDPEGWFAYRHSNTRSGTESLKVEFR
jgi:proteasome lid subunit RPN8/RPN11